MKAIMVKLFRDGRTHARMHTHKKGTQSRYGTQTWGEKGRSRSRPGIMRGRGRVLTGQRVLAPNLHPNDGFHWHFCPRYAHRVGWQVYWFQNSECALLRNVDVAYRVTLRKNLSATCT